MTDNYFARYLPLLIHFALACLLAVAIVTLSYLIGQHKANKSKMSPYECGMEPVGRCSPAIQRKVLPGCHALHPV